MAHLGRNFWPKGDLRQAAPIREPVIKTVPSRRSLRHLAVPRECVEVRDSTGYNAWWRRGVPVRATSPTYRRAPSHERTMIAPARVTERVA